MTFSKDLASKLPDLGLLLLAPLAVAGLGRKKNWQHWTWPLTGVLLVVAVVSSGTALANTSAISPESGQMPQVQVPALSENGLLLSPAPAVQPEPAPRAQSAGTITTTRVISYTYDPLNRLTAADYSTGESYEYAYDAVGNRTAMTDTSGVHTYTYDATNRLTSADGVPYTWDARGNLLSDGTFTYTYNAAGRMVWAAGVTATLVYTYNAAGLRVAQSVNGDVTTFAWDWASGLPEMLNEGGNLYLVGHETLGQWDGATWAYYLPDALGSVRQVVDGAGTVVSAREWTPYGVEVGGAQAGLGYTGEWWDASLGLQYLRARWYDVGVGRFTQKDPARWGRNLYLYANASPVMSADPSGLCTYRVGDPPQTCRVESGDNLFRIALKNSVTVDQLVAWNTIPDRNQISVNQMLYLYDRASGSTAPDPSAPAGDWWYGTSGYLEG